MYVHWSGQLVRIRPWESPEELFAYALRNNLQPNEQLGPSWYPHALERQLFSEAGLIDGIGVNAFAVEERATGALAGFVAATIDAFPSLAVEVGTFLLPEFRQRGFGAEAKQLLMCYVFENYPVARVGAWTLATHARARRGLERCGMHLEGFAHGAYFSQGEFVDRVYYVIFREEWERMPIRHCVQRG